MGLPLGLRFHRSEVSLKASQARDREAGGSPPFFASRTFQVSRIPADLSTRWTKDPHTAPCDCLGPCELGGAALRPDLVFDSGAQTQGDGSAFTRLHGDVLLPLFTLPVPSRASTEFHE